MSLKKLILIEDDDVIVYLTQKLIKESKSIELLNVLKNGRKALDYFIENAKNAELLPDFIFLDLSMPILDGWQFLEEFARIKDSMAKNIQIYITTSSISPKDLSKAESYDFISDFVIKPISLENFNRIVNSDF